LLQIIVTYYCNSDGARGSQLGEPSISCIMKRSLQNISAIKAKKNTQFRYISDGIKAVIINGRRERQQGSDLEDIQKLPLF